MSENLTSLCAAVRETRNPLPGVLNTTPRGELALKKVGGNGLGEANWSGTPSQLISRRPVSGAVPLFALSVPRSARNWSTVAWIAAPFAPDADRVRGSAWAVLAYRRKTVVSSTRSRRMARTYGPALAPTIGQAPR